MIYHSSTGVIHGTYASSTPVSSTPTTAVATSTSDADAARIEITLPVAGQLVIDNYTVPQTSDRHVYITSPLAKGEKRTITLKSQNATREVTVTAGQSLQVTLTPAAAGVAAR